MRLFLILTICPSCSGCIVYGVPRLELTPTLPADVPEVRAFRIVETRADVLGSTTLEKREVFEIPLAGAGVGPQWNLHVDTGYGGLLPPVSGKQSQRLSIALYRPGFEVIRIEAASLWSVVQERKPMEWKRIDVSAQLAELEKITPQAKHWSERAPFGGPPFGPWTTDPPSTTPELRAFLKGERERIETCP